MVNTWRPADTKPSQWWSRGMSATFLPSIDNWATRLVPKFGTRCTIRRPPARLSRAWVSVLLTKIAQAKARTRKILKLGLEFIIQVSVRPDFSPTPSTDFDGVTDEIVAVSSVAAVAAVVVAQPGPGNPESSSSRMPERVAPDRLLRSRLISMFAPDSQRPTRLLLESRVAAI